MNLLKYLLHRATWEKLPMLPRMYSTDYKPHEVDRQTATLMRLSHLRCPQGVRILMRRHRMTSKQELILYLPVRRRKRRILARLASIVRRELGVLPYDPMKSIAREHMRRGRR